MTTTLIVCIVLALIIAPKTILAAILYPLRRRFFWRWYSLYLSSEYWHLFTRIFKNGFCQKCHRDGTWRNPLQMHHENYRILFREWLHPFDMKTLCKECHDRVTQAHREHLAAFLR